jgi:regulator of cell morphogenesis and NO signaling
MDLRERTLGEIAVDHPAATRVFLRHKLDFCCGGKRSLELACAQAGLDVDAIERELERESSRADDASSWQARSSAEIADHIEAQYHATLRRDVPALIQAARKVEKVHAEKAAVPAGLGDELSAFWDEMQHHMRKEEEILFPLLRRGGHGAMVEMPVRVMEREHDEHATRLARIRELTHSMQPPSYACATWRALYAGLTALEKELMLHIHLENNILFVRALAAA